MKSQFSAIHGVLTSDLEITGSSLTTAVAQAAKPGGREFGEIPTHHHVSLGTGWYESIGTMNDAGALVASMYAEGPSGALSDHMMLILPADTDHDGLPDCWCSDANADGWNDRAIDLGFPPQCTAANEIWRVNPPMINDAGQVAGAATIYLDPDGRQCLDALLVVTPRDVEGDGRLQWFVPDDNGANSLMTLVKPGIPRSSMLHPAAMNHRGQIAGHYITADELVHAFVLSAKDRDADELHETWHEDVNHDGRNDLLAKLGLAMSSAGGFCALEPRCINNPGQVAGNLYQHNEPFMITPGISRSDGRLIYFEDRNGDAVNDLVVKLPLLASGAGKVLGLSDSGVAVGWSLSSRGEPHAVVWCPDAEGRMIITDLGVFAGTNRTFALSVNDALQIVGYGDCYSNGKVVSQAAFLWQNGVMRDLRDFLDQGPSLAGVNMQAFQITHSGLIRGTARSPFIAVPIRK